ncbi:MAG: hypothetical protein RI554_08610 [Trueperaceae bacterium]|nr:hypothetical protein [Trueperaceae bacterium]
MDTLLLILHVVGGTLALLALPVALLARKRRGVHTAAGLAFVAGMAVAVGSAFPLAVLIGSPFLGAVAAFSAYLIASGWRWIRRPGVGTSAAWGRGLAAAMLVAALPMGVQGIAQVAAGDGLGAVLLVFAAIGGSLAIEDLRSLSAERLGKAARTTLHLGRMIGGGIATVTAVLVVNVAFEPAWVVWLAPTAVGAPLIAVWSARLAPKRPSART